MKNFIKHIDKHLLWWYNPKCKEVEKQPRSKGDIIMTQEQAINNIITIIKNSDDDDLFYINNHYQDEVNGDNLIYPMDDFDDFMSSLTPLELSCRIFYGEFNPNHKYFWFNGYGNLCSSDYASDFPYIFENEIAEWCVENDEDFGIHEIREVLDEYNEDEDEAEA